MQKIVHIWSMFAWIFKGCWKRRKAKIIEKTNGFSMILAFWLMIKMSSKSCQKESKNLWKIIKKLSKNRSERHSKNWYILGSIFEPIFNDFSMIFGIFLTTFWIHFYHKLKSENLWKICGLRRFQQSFKIQAKIDQKSIQKSIIFLNALRIDFWTNFQWFFNDFSTLFDNFLNSFLL